MLSRETTHPATPAVVVYPIGDRSFDIHVGRGCVPQIAEAIRDLRADRLLVIADAVAFGFHGQELVSALLEATSRPVDVLPTVEARECEKSLAVVSALLDQASRIGATRRSLVVSFGGGLAANVAGMVAGLLFRGIRLVHLPTTLLAASDGVLSSKQAVNGGLGKNQFGLYLVPTFVALDTGWLDTLPGEEWTNGFVELVKNALSFDDRLLSLMSGTGGLETWARPSNATEVILAGIASKAPLTAADPNECRDGVVLEYGHTAGHALELLLGMSHGAAVALGMLVAAQISVTRNWMSHRSMDLHRSLLGSVSAPLSPPRRFPFDEILLLLRRDNKRGRVPCPHGSHPWVLLEEIGSPARTDGLPLVAVAEDEVRAAMSHLDWLL